MLEDRSLISAPGRSRICVTGPLMSGDSSWLRRSKEEARRAAGLAQGGRVLLVAFDLPTFADGVLRKHRIAINRIGKPVHEGFFAGLVKILERFPDVDIVVKPKRGPGDRRFHVGHTYEALLDPQGRWQRSGRVKVLESDIDPYLPVAAADMCVGMPFTSPIAASAFAGKPAAWYDPVGFVTAAFPPELNQTLLRGTEQLAAWVQEHRSGPVPSVPDTLVAGVSDPGAAFAALLDQEGSIK